MALSTFRKVLEVICVAGGGTVEGVAALAGVPREDVEVVVSELLASGLLAEAKGGGCGSCPLKRFCPLASCPSGAGLRILYLTDRGRRVCEGIKGGGRHSS